MEKQILASYNGLLTGGLGDLDAGQIAKRAISFKHGSAYSKQLKCFLLFLPCILPTNFSTIVCAYCGKSAPGTKGYISWKQLLHHSSPAVPTCLLVTNEYHLAPRGKVSAKNKGEIEMFFAETISISNNDVIHS